MPHSPPHLKVAFTTNSLTWVDVDFVRARHLVFYDVTPEAATFLDARDFRPPAEDGNAGIPGCPGPGEAPLLGDHLAAKFVALEGRGLLFTTGLSDRTAMRVADAGTFPVVIEHRRAIDHVTGRLRTLLRRDPPLWLCRVLHYGALPHSPIPLDIPAHDRF